MGADLFEQLAGLAWTASGALLGVLLLRRAARRWLGAALAYQLWLLVPAAMLAALIPSLPAAEQPVLLVPAAMQLTTYTGPVLARGSIAWTNWALLGWAAGAVLFAAWFGRAHAAFLRSLGTLTEHDGIFYSETASGGPASVGLLRPKVVVPADFARRYTAGEQALVIAHERIHGRRRDAIANCVQAALQCLFWFNPIVHIAAGRFRLDQELACDAAVVRDQPQARRQYAVTMLQTQVTLTASPGTINCHWQSNHPLKERIMTLQQTPPRAARRLTGRLLLASLVCAGGYGAWTAHAATAPAADAKTYAIAMTFTSGAGKATPRVRVRGGGKFKVAIDDNGTKAAASFVITAAGPDSVKLDGKVECAGAAPAHPVLIARLGEAATVKMQQAGAPSCELAITVTEVASLTPAS